MERSVYAHMTRFSLAPLHFRACRECLCVSLPPYSCVGVCFHVNVWKDSSVQGCVRGRAPNRGGINEDNMSHIFGSGAGTGNEARLVWVTAAHVLVCHCPVSLCVKLADIDTCSP